MACCPAYTFFSLSLSIYIYRYINVYMYRYHGDLMVLYIYNVGIIIKLIS